jgi:hypothetical protein
MEKELNGGNAILCFIYLFIYLFIWIDSDDSIFIFKSLVEWEIDNLCYFQTLFWWKKLITT